MTDTDKLLQGFREFLVLKRNNSDFVNKCVNAVQKRFLSKITIDEFRTKSDYEIADMFSDTTGGRRYCRIIIRLFQQYLQEAVV